MSPGAAESAGAAESPGAEESSVAAGSSGATESRVTSESPGAVGRTGSGATAPSEPLAEAELMTMQVSAGALGISAKVWSNESSGAAESLGAAELPGTA